MGTGVAVNLAGPPEPNSSGELALQFVVGVGDGVLCSDVEDRVTLVAFVDDQQVPIGDLGTRPVFSLHEGEAAQFVLTMAGLPPAEGTPSTHRLQLWSLSGEGLYTEAPPGELSPWFGLPRQVRRFSW